MKCTFSILSHPHGTPSHDHHRLPHHHVTMSQMASYVGNTGPLSVCVDANNWNSYVGHQPPLSTHHQPPSITSSNSTPRSPGTREASCQTAARALTTVSRSLVSTLRPTGRCVVNRVRRVVWCWRNAVTLPLPSQPPSLNAPLSLSSGPQLLGHEFRRVGLHPPQVRPEHLQHRQRCDLHDRQVGLSPSRQRFRAGCMACVYTHLIQGPSWRMLLWSHQCPSRCVEGGVLFISSMGAMGVVKLVAPALR